MMTWAKGPAVPMIEALANACGQAGGGAAGAEENGWAAFTTCGGYRWALMRWWDDVRPLVAFIGLNPSKANASVDDATVRLWRGFARRWGYGGFVAVNAYCQVATFPHELFASFDGEPIPRLLRTGDPVKAAGVIRAAARESALVVACWGGHIEPEREAEVCRLVAAERKPVHILGLTRAGQPRHPRGVRRDAQPMPWGTLVSDWRVCF